MFLTKMALPRRTFLRGLGVTLGLPLLDAMIPALGAQALTAPVRRFGAIYLPHGKLMSNWTPATEGAGFEFTPILQPLAPFRDDLTVISGLSAGPTAPNGGHAVAPASYLTGNIQPKQTESADVRASTTVDQAIARAIGQETPFPSLEVATEDFSTSVGACDTGFSCIYMNTISWASPTTPLPMEVNPRVVFERMFGGTGTAAQRIARMRQNKSILDAVSEKTRTLQGGLGTRDRERLDQYLDNVREIERRIERAERQASTTPVSLQAPVGAPEQYDEHVALLFELLATAFQADVTRVFTFMVARDVSNISFPQIGVPDPHHALSHEANGRGDAEKAVKFTKVNAHHVQLFAKFVEKLKSTPDGDGSLLDHSMILYGSGMSNGNDHTHHPLPILVAGRGAGQMKKLGQHVVYPNLTPMANLMLSLAQKSGAPIEQFGQSTGPLDV